MPNQPKESANHNAEEKQILSVSSAALPRSLESKTPNMAAIPQQINEPPKVASAETQQSQTASKVSESSPNGNWALAATTHPSAITRTAFMLNLKHQNRE